MDDRAAVEEAVRGYFRALAAGEPVAGLLGGPAAEFHALIERAWPNRGAPVAAAVRELAVESVEGDQAVARLEAVVEYRSAAHRQSIRHSGPVVLERRDGAWRMVDWQTQGRRLLPSLFPRAAGSASAAGVSGSVVGARLSAAGTSVVLSIRNETGTALRARRTTVGRRRQGRWSYLTAWLLPEEVPEGESLGVVVANGSLPLSTTDLRIVLELDGAVGATALDLPVSLTGEAQAASRPGARVPAGVRLATWVNTRTAWCIVLTALAAWVVLDVGGWLGVLFALAQGGALVYVFARHRRRLSRDPAIVGPPLAATGAIVLLALYGVVRAATAPGCGPPAPTADAFVRALLVSGPEAAKAYVPSDADEIRDNLDGYARVSTHAARRVLATRERDSLSCGAMRAAARSFGAPSGGPCFGYQGLFRLSGVGEVTVMLGCHGGRWRVEGFG